MSRVIRVRVDGALNGDGSQSNPYRRVTDALRRAEALSDAASGPAHEPIIIDVGPGTYTGSYKPDSLAAHPEWEILPLWIDVSHVQVRGSTKIMSGLERGESLVLQEDTVLDVDEPIESPSASAGNLQSIMAVGPTTARPSVVVEVGIEGVHFDGVHGSGTGLYVDRVARFVVRRNVFERLRNGTRSRGSSGDWSHNYARANDQGAVLTGGGVVHPASISVTANRCTGNRLLGLLLNAQGSYALPFDPGQTGLQSSPIQTVFDLSSQVDRDHVPDALAAVLNGGDYSDNGYMGLRFFEVGVRPNTYMTAALDQLMDSHLRVRLSGASFERNGFANNLNRGYGVALDAGFPERQVDGAAQPDYTGVYSLKFSDCVFSGNQTASLLVAFTRADVGITTRFKPLHNARIEVIEDAPIDAIYDDPQYDPIIMSRLDNVLVVNQADVPANAPFGP